MMIALSGTPGTGKSSVALLLAEQGVPVIPVNDTIEPYVTGFDEEMATRIVDTDLWVSEFPRYDGIVEGHIAHLLPADRIIILRCRPDILKERLIARGYHQEKVAENVEAELLDVILIEALNEHDPDLIYEIDTTDENTTEVAARIRDVMSGAATPSHGAVDWLSICADLI